LAKAFDRITAAPASVLKLDAGRIAVGAAADLCIFDKNAYWHVEPRALKSQGHNTPFLGYELPARVRTTIVSGQVAFEQR
jgi:dihydroorotase